MSGLSRSVLRKYLEAQAYRGFYISDSDDRLFYFEEVEVTVPVGEPSKVELLLKMAVRAPEPRALDGDHFEAFDLTQAKTLSTANFMTKSASVVDYFPDRGELLLVMDEANEERYNLFSLDLETGLQRQLTKVSQALMPRVSLDRKSVWFTSRESVKGGGFLSTLCKVDLESGVVTRLIDDELSEYKLNFVAPLEMSPTRIFIFMDKGARRQEFQLFDVDLSTGEMQACLDEDFSKQRNYLASEYMNGEEFFFVSLKNGHENLFAFNIVTREVRALTDAQSKNQVGILGLGPSCEAFIFQIFDRLPDRNSEIVYTDLAGGEFLRQNFDSVVSPIRHKSSLWVCETTMTRAPRLLRVHTGRKSHVDSLSTQTPTVTILRLHDPREADDLVQCTREIASYRSFDGLEIPAFLFLPKNPLRGAIVIGFYGGSDYFATRYQMLLEQGIAILSPAVRGSWGWGQEWEDRLKGDLGGGEILDVIWGARFLSKVLGLPENKVGVEGGSHGGYAVLRTLTMPAEFRGVDTRFNFGFGLCWAGFADLIEFYKSSWISDWLVDLLGPYPEKEELYRDRSPATHFKELKTPLFISHGRNDRRVPLSTMTSFIEELTDSKLQHKVLIQDGEGHKGAGLEKELEALEAEFSFMNAVLDGQDDDKQKKEQSENFLAL